MLQVAISLKQVVDLIALWTAGSTAGIEPSVFPAAGLQRVDFSRGETAQRVDFSRKRTPELATRSDGTAI